MQKTKKNEMTPLELAREYMDCMFESGDFDQLRKILSEDLQFHGPLYNFNSADEYINSLRIDPPKDFGYEIIRTYSDNSSACLIYRFAKPGVKTVMSQTFCTDGEKIKSILLVFDSSAFRR